MSDGASLCFVMAGGGTGGHVVPLVAVARELRRRGHECRFVGTRDGFEARLVPQHGFPLEFIGIGGLMGVGLARKAKTAVQLPLSAARIWRRLGQWRAAGVFSMGGYVAGPAVIAALLRGLPVVAMEPNARPGVTNLRLGRRVARTLIAFEETARYFPPGKWELTGLPVRDEFFSIGQNKPGERLNLLITGGSRGSRTLNRAAEESWPLFRQSGLRVRLVHQTGKEECDSIRDRFAQSGVEGEIVPFIDDMPAAYAAAHLVVSRSGAGAVAELAAAGRPAVLVPFPFATGDHQRSNAEALERAGAARMVRDSEMTGLRLFEIVRELAAKPDTLESMGHAARRLARRGAASRAADLLESLARGKE
ncbi:MAG: undecaprenyldiphospho-muramoylpentapeptide beta-N-acetylglucosaminyltransferase [Bryobacteraceae bacterium]